MLLKITFYLNTYNFSFGVITDPNILETFTSWGEMGLRVETYFEGSFSYLEYLVILLFLAQLSMY